MKESSLKFGACCLLLILVSLALTPVVYPQIGENLTSNNSTYNPLTIIQEQGEKLVKQLEKAYSWHQYKKVVEISKKISILFPLSAKDNLIIAESYLRLGFPEEAISYANKVISLRKNTFTACRAKLIKISALIVKGKTYGLKKELKKLASSFCGAKFKEDIDALLYFLGSKVKPLPPSSILKETLGVITKAKGLYLLRLKKPDAAKYYIFLYLNVYGRLEDAPPLLFKLAEAYFKQGKRDQAKTYYELIITKWDGTKQALLSKFRLYEIAYQQILIKQLVPKQTIEDLLSYIAEIKYRYPKEEIAKEAHLLEIEIYRQYGKYAKLRESAKEFIEKYPHYPEIKKVYRYYCESMVHLFNHYYSKKNLPILFKLLKDDRKFLKITHCGYPYYLTGSIYFDYNLYLPAVCNLVTAREVGLPKKFLPDTMIKLNFLAFETGEKKLFNLLTKINLKNLKNRSKNCYFTFVKGVYLLETKGLNSAKHYLGKVLNCKLNSFYKWQFLHMLRNQALKEKKFASALKYTELPQFNATSWDYVILAAETFKNNPSLFPTVVLEGLKRFPNSTELTWLNAYYLEKHGKIKESLNFWKKLLKGKSLESILAEIYKTRLELINKSQKVLY